MLRAVVFRRWKLSWRDSRCQTCSALELIWQNAQVWFVCSEQAWVWAKRDRSSILLAALPRVCRTGSERQIELWDINSWQRQSQLAFPVLLALRLAVCSSPSRSVRSNSRFQTYGRPSFARPSLSSASNCSGCWAPQLHSQRTHLNSTKEIEVSESMSNNRSSSSSASAAAASALSTSNFKKEWTSGRNEWCNGTQKYLRTTSSTRSR